METGRVVISSAGHDGGGWFVVAGAAEGCVYIADGKERRLASPKKKNIRHVRATKHVIELTGLTDKGLRRALRLLREQSIAEESE